MSTWLMVRSNADMETAWREANALSCALRQLGGKKAGNELQGVWVDPALATQPPTELFTFSDTGQKLRFKILESTGLAGIWLLCRIQREDADRPAGRSDILKALINSSTEPDRQALNQMVPVFSTEAEDREVQTEMQYLAAIAASAGISLLSPWFQESSNGRFIALERAVKH